MYQESKTGIPLRIGAVKPLKCKILLTAPCTYLRDLIGRRTGKCGLKFIERCLRLRAGRAATLRRQLFGQQAIVLALDDRITFASAPLQPRAIEHRDVATRVTNQAGLL
jgi:hypothetical protein